MLLPGLLLAVTLHAFHGMAVVTVIPQVTEDLAGRALYGAFFSSYLLASLLGLVWAGQSLQRLGVRLVLGSCLAVFGVGVLGSALAPTMPWLVSARALEGFGGGGVSAVLYAVVNLVYDDEERPGVLAWMSAAWVLPGLLGPPIAGWIAETWGWRWVFAGVLPAVALAAVMTLPALHSVGVSAASGGQPGRMREAFGLAIGVGGMLVALTWEPGWIAALLLVAGGSLSLVSGLRILPTGTFVARPGLGASIATKFLANFAFFGAEAFLPLALRDLRGWTLVEAGTVLTASALSWTAGAFLHSRLAPRVSARVVATSGAALILVGIAGVALLVLEPVPPGFAHGVWAIAGLGMGLVFNTSTTSAMEDTGPGQEGSTSTALGIADGLGFALAAGIGGAILVAGERAALSDATSMASICFFMIGASALLALTALRLERRVSPRIATA